MNGTLHLTVAVILALNCSGFEEKHFPEFRVLLLTFEGAWEQAPTVVVGDIKNVTELGVQTVEHLPPPILPAIQKLYWCQADIEVLAILKGIKPDTRKKLVWGSVKPGCRTSSVQQWNKEEGPVTGIWFLREENEYIRPVVDGGREFYYSFRVAWDNESDVPAQTRFGRLLLNPLANSSSLRAYAQGSFELMGLGCLILGREECVARIEGLAGLHDLELRSAACDFLSSQFLRECPAIEEAPKFRK